MQPFDFKYLIYKLWKISLPQPQAHIFYDLPGSLPICIDNPLSSLTLTSGAPLFILAS